MPAMAKLIRKHIFKVMLAEFRENLTARKYLPDGYDPETDSGNLKIAHSKVIAFLERSSKMTGAMPKKRPVKAAKKKPAAKGATKKPTSAAKKKAAGEARRAVTTRATETAAEVVKVRRGHKAVVSDENKEAVAVVHNEAVQAMDAIDNAA